MNMTTNRMSPVTSISTTCETELGLTQQMLAEKMNCTQQYISKVLKGKKNMSLETICKIENALGIEIIKGLNTKE